MYKETDYNAALIEFRRAYELDPKFQVLYNIAEAYYQIPDYANALKTFEKYLKDGGAQLSAERRLDVVKEIEKLRTRVAKVEVTANFSDVEIAVDDVSIGKTPLAEPILVSTGRRRLTATRLGKPPVTQVVELAGGDLKKIAFTMPEDAPVVEEKKPIPVVPWVITGALAVGWGITGGLALSASNDVTNDRAHLTTAGTLSNDHNRAVTLAGISDALGVTAVLMGGLSVYMTVRATARPSHTDDTAPPPPPAALMVRPVWLGNQEPAADGREVRLMAGPHSVVLSARF
jgi:hypothetical protein